MRKLFVVFLVFAMFGCASQAGPFVTNISSDGRGGLTVEKCMVRLDRMINTVESSNCTNTLINLAK